MNTDTPRTDACPHCGAGIKNAHAEPQWQIYTCGAVPNGALRSDLCFEREKSQKLEGEVEKLKRQKISYMALVDFATRQDTELKAEVERLKDLLSQAITEIEMTPFHNPRLTAFTAHKLGERYREKMTNN